SGRPVAGVSITATHIESGQKITAATDANGAYRLPVRVGAYEITYSAAGFATVQRMGVELLLGQTGIVNIQMTESSEARTVTVTGEVQLANAGGSTNIDERQTEDIPLNGRQATDLAKNAVGNAQTKQSDEPVDTGTGTYQLNYDGQRVTQNL